MAALGGVASVAVGRQKKKKSGFGLYDVPVLPPYQLAEGNVTPKQICDAACWGN